MAQVKKHEEWKGKQWECRWSFKDQNGMRKFQKQRFRTEKEAKAKAREVEGHASDGISIDHNPGKAPFKEWADRWHASLVAQGAHKPSTLRGYRKILDGTVIPTFGQRAVKSITTADVRDFVTACRGERGMAPPTIRHHYGVLRLVLGFAAEDGAIRINPAVGVKRLPSDRSTGRIKPAPTAMSEGQVAKLADHLDKTPPYGLMIRFMAYTGLRAGEIAGLNVGDLDLLRNRVVVRRTRTKVKGGWEEHTPKSGKERQVPLPRWLADDLTGYLATHPNNSEPDAPLWPGRKANDTERFRHAKGGVDFDKPWERDAFYKRQFKPALKATGLPANVRLHDLRHTAGSIMLSNGIPPYRVAEYLGHSLPVLLGIYAHILDTDVTADMDKLARPTHTASNVRQLHG